MNNPTNRSRNAIDDRAAARWWQFPADMYLDHRRLSWVLLSRTHMGVIGDSINLAARLNTAAGCDEIVVSNTLYQRLPDTLRVEFQELPPVEAKNTGRIRAWKLGPRRAPIGP